MYFSLWSPPALPQILHFSFWQDTSHDNNENQGQLNSSCRTCHTCFCWYVELVLTLLFHYSPRKRVNQWGMSTKTGTTAPEINPCLHLISCNFFILKRRWNHSNIKCTIPGEVFLSCKEDTSLVELQPTSAGTVQNVREHQQRMRVTQALS